MKYRIRCVTFLNEDRLFFIDRKSFMFWRKCGSYDWLNEVFEETTYNSFEAAMQDLEKMQAQYKTVTVKTIQIVFESENI